MWKSIVAGTAALAIVGTSIVYAQRGREEGRERWQPSMEDFRAFGEARLAALKAGPPPTPGPGKNMPPGPGGGPLFRDRFGWREGGWFHFGPNRTQDNGTGHMERSGAERL